MTGMPNDYSKDIEEMLEWFIARFRRGKVPTTS